MQKYLVLRKSEIQEGYGDRDKANLGSVINVFVDDDLGCWASWFGSSRVWKISKETLENKNPSEIVYFPLT